MCNRTVTSVTHYVFTQVERTLKLITYLQEYRSRTEIAEHFEISIRSVGRYINLLVQLGFKVNRLMRKYHYFKITNTKDFFHNLGRQHNKREIVLS